MGASKSDSAKGTYAKSCIFKYFLHSADLIPRVLGFNPEHAEQGAEQLAEMERVVLLQEEHAHARDDVVEHHNQNANPPG